MGNSLLRGHPSAMTADQYYDAEAKRGVNTQTEEALGLSSVPFFERPMDADESDRIVGEDEAGNLIRQTISGNRYFVSLNPDQRTARTKIEEDVIPAVKKFADNPRLPTKDEVVGAGTAIVKGAVETASIPGDILTGKRSPTDVQMGDVFELTGGSSAVGATQKLPDNAMGMFVGRKSAEIREGNSEPVFIKEWKKLHGESPRTEEWDSGDDYPHVVAEVNHDINNFPETLKELEKVGWFKGRDGKLRREISDEPAFFNSSLLSSPTSAEIQFAGLGSRKDIDTWSTLGNTLKHESFFEQYPEFKDTPIIVDNSLRGTNTQGYFKPGAKFIAINPEVLTKPEELKAIALHEIMHLVQDKENFSGGSNSEGKDVIKFYDYEKNKPEAKAAWSKYENDLTELRKTFYPAVLKKNKELFEFMLQRTAKDEGVPIEKLRAAAKEATKITQAGKGGRLVFHDLANKEFQNWIDAGKPKRTFVKYPKEIPSVSWANDLSSMNTYFINKKLNNLNAEVEFAKDSMKQTNSIIATIYSDEDAELFKKITGKSPTKKMADMTADRFEGKDNIHSYADFIGLKDKPPERPLYVNPNEKFNEQKNTLFKIYQRNMGETEARNVESRMDYTQEEIDAGSIIEHGEIDDYGFSDYQTQDIKPFNTEDIPADMQWNEKEFAQGGLTMNNQTQMAFALGGEAETVDPVSGNDIPPGSLPAEVRDDLPARLSEGEYVVPADVVRFFGVRVFEEMRAEAKRGLQQMEADGRIGGDPVPPMQMAQGPEQDIDAMIDAEMASMNSGGVVQGYDDGADVARARIITPTVRYTGLPFNYGYGQPLQAAAEMQGLDVVKPVVDTVATTPTEPAGGCPEGYLWNGTMCVVDLSIDNSDDNDPTVPDPQKWYETDDGLAIVDPITFMDREIEKTDKVGDNILTSIFGGVIGKVGVAIKKAVSASDVAAAYRLEKAMGFPNVTDKTKQEYYGKWIKDNTGNYSDGDWKLDDIAKKFGYKDGKDLEKQSASDIIRQQILDRATTYKNNRLFDEGKGFDDRNLTIYNDTGYTVEGGPTGADRYGGGTYRGTGKDSSDGGSYDVYSPTVETTRPKLRPDDLGGSSSGSGDTDSTNTSATGRTKADVQKEINAKISAATDASGNTDWNKADVGDLVDERSTFNSNKGGLATRPKKTKKKTKAYKKGGLASKKK